MPKSNPFIIKASGKDIRDRQLSDWNENDIDGDILLAPSLAKHPRIKWSTFQNNRIFFAIGILLFAGLFSKLFYLQIVQGKEYYALAENNRLRKIFEPAPRGVVFSSDNERLAYNTPNFALYVVPGDLPRDQDEEDKIFLELEKILLVPAFDLIESFVHVPRSSLEPFEIKRGLTNEQAIVLAQREKNWSGVFIKPIEQRTYLTDQAFSHLLGYVGKMTSEEWTAFKTDGYNLNEYVGKTGLENNYQKILRGSPGYSLIEVNSLGKEKKLVSEEKSRPGANLYLHIDAGLQAFIGEELKKTLAGARVDSGSVIALDPRNGAVLSLVSFPGYNNWDFSKGLSKAEYQILFNDQKKPLFNRAIAGEYPSGSTIKIVVGAAALEEGLIDENWTINSVGGITINGYNFPDWKAGGHGLTNIVKALSQSVNTFFYIIGGGLDKLPGLGVDKINRYAKLFGLSAPAGIDLPGEGAGFLPTPQWKEKIFGERWYLGDTYHLAIGQGGILVTPLQVANFTAAVANGGTLFKPKIASYFQPEGEDKNFIASEVLRKDFLSEKTAEIIGRGLREAAVSGSAASLSSLPVEAAGKTGTAEVGGDKEPHAWFTGFAPFSEPEIVVTVMIEQGQGGNLTATPLAKKVFEWYFSKTK